MAYQENYRKKSTIFYASAISSIISTILTNPIEVAKLNLQYSPVACALSNSSLILEGETIAIGGSSMINWSGTLHSLKIAVPQVVISNILYY